MLISWHSPGAQQIYEKLVGYHVLRRQQQGYRMEDAEHDVKDVVDQSEFGSLIHSETVFAQLEELALRSDDLDHILTGACWLIGRALGTDLAKLMELADDGETLLVRAGVGWKAGIVGVVTLKAAANTSENYALKTRDPMISPNIATETRFNHPQYLMDHGVRAVANVIIIGSQNKRPFGILQTGSRTPRHFTEANVNFVRNFANLLAACRMRVVEEFPRSRNELEARVIERTRESVETNDKLQAAPEERERVEEVLRQWQKMEAVSQLIGGLAHDFNNMLAGIAGNLELIRISVGQGRAAELGRYIDSATASTERATTLTQRLLAFARRQTHDPRPTDVNPLIGGMDGLLWAQSGQPFTSGSIWPMSHGQSFATRASSKTRSSTSSSTRATPCRRADTSRSRRPTSPCWTGASHLAPIPSRTCHLVITWL